MVTADMVSGEKGCLLVALRVNHADADACAQKLVEINHRLEAADGFGSLDVIRRDGGLGTDYYILARFEDVASLEKWKSSPERQALTREIETYSTTDVSREQAAGSNIWFEPVVNLPSTPRPPLLWKRWLISMIAVYPLLIVLAHLLKPITSRLPLELGLLLVAVILTGLNAAFIVPWLTKHLHTWLVRR